MTSIKHKLKMHKVAHKHFMFEVFFGRVVGFTWQKEVFTWTQHR
jgi:hypothetical protein